eukprot:gnl/Dysnectes_brevis/4328_a5760_713.p1 GENE.gnl/Dysnectes_brevis/4328_a5760_713~~gnl/Dysnectes_brevis/4328_a5760_713.p1  ORF type:complete len:436 (+),score=72.23 gnl/Dysnectes_brevis/4328_a5760_713:123-1430(+)
MNGTDIFEESFILSQLQTHGAISVKLVAFRHRQKVNAAKQYLSSILRSPPLSFLPLHLQGISILQSHNTDTLMEDGVSTHVEGDVGLETIVMQPQLTDVSNESHLHSLVALTTEHTHRSDGIEVIYSKSIELADEYVNQLFIDDDVDTATLHCSISDTPTVLPPLSMCRLPAILDQARIDKDKQTKLDRQKQDKKAERAQFRSQRSTLDGQLRKKKKKTPKSPRGKASKSLARHIASPVSRSKKQEEVKPSRDRQRPLTRPNVPGPSHAPDVLDIFESEPDSEDILSAGEAGFLDQDSEPERVEEMNQQPTDRLAAGDVFDSLDAVAPSGSHPRPKVEMYLQQDSAFFKTVTTQKMVVTADGSIQYQTEKQRVRKTDEEIRELTRKAAKRSADHDRSVKEEKKKKAKNPRRPAASRKKKPTQRTLDAFFTVKKKK